MLLFKTHRVRSLVGGGGKEHILNSESFPCTRPGHSQFTVYNLVTRCCAYKVYNGRSAVQKSRNQEATQFYRRGPQFLFSRIYLGDVLLEEVSLTADSRILMVYIEYY